jgi:hypothetical protein
VWQFNHVICAYGEGTSRVFFDPTSRHCEFGNLPYSDVGAMGLVLRPNGAEKVRIPLPENPATTITIEGSLQQAGNCRFRAELRNDLLRGARWILEDKRTHATANRFSSMLADELQKIAFDSVRLVSDSDDVIVVEGTADLSKFIINGSEGRRYLPRLAFSVSDADLLARESDTFAIYPTPRSPLLVTLELASDGSTLNADSTAISGGGASFAATATASDNGRLHFEYRIAHRESYLSGKSRQLFLDYYRALLEARAAVFTLSSAQQ